jgi:hypothetical protein
VTSLPAREQRVPEDAADTRTCGHSADEHGPYGCTVDGSRWSCWCGTPRHLLAMADMRTDTTADDLREAAAMIRQRRTFPERTLADAVETLAEEYERVQPCEVQPAGCANCNDQQWSVPLFALWARAVIGRS